MCLIERLMPRAFTQTDPWDRVAVLRKTLRIHDKEVVGFASKQMH